MKRRHVVKKKTPAARWRRDDALVRRLTALNTRHPIYAEAGVFAELVTQVQVLREHIGSVCKTRAEQRAGALFVAAVTRLVQCESRLGRLEEEREKEIQRRNKRRQRRTR